MSDVRKVINNTFYQLLGKIATMGITVFVTALVTRNFGVEGYGVYSLMVGFPALFYIVADFGLNAIATRDLSVDGSQAASYLGNIIVLRVVFSALLILLGLVVLSFLPYESDVKLGVSIALFTILTMSLFTSSNIGFQVKLRYDFSNIASLAGALLIPLLIYLMVLSDVKLMYFGVVIVASGLLTATVAFSLLKKLGIEPSFKINLTMMKRLLAESLPLGLMFVFSQINFKADSVLLSFLPLPGKFGLSNIESVGVYGLAYKIFEVSLVLCTFFMNSVYPIMVKHYAESRRRLFLTFRKVLVFMFLSGLFVGFLGFVFSDLIIYLLGGSGFSESARVLRVFMAFILIFYLTQPISWLIVTMGGQRFLLAIYFLAALVNLSLNFVFIPKYSFYASVNITWISELVILTLLSFTAFRLAKRP